MSDRGYESTNAQTSVHWLVPHRVSDDGQEENPQQQVAPSNPPEEVPGPEEQIHEVESSLADDELASGPDQNSNEHQVHSPAKGLR